MIKTTFLIFFTIFATISLCSDVKWIPIKPISTNESQKQDTNKSKTGTVLTNGSISGIKVIEYLLDYKKGKESLDERNNKNWYILDTKEEN
ncbi:hypothetical protein [Sulfurimonas sp.]|uniref:hypothetical protein n=1 Tax=Sulfurimonas sp. TaxID=2022749 RepID=UPI0025E1058E|nr:hypothetical protein [Sulfurimonas sp.]MDD5158350.1 hypothetical protein [Sulfurimonas sp.]